MKFSLNAEDLTPFHSVFSLLSIASCFGRRYNPDIPLEKGRMLQNVSVDSRYRYSNLLREIQVVRIRNGLNLRSTGTDTALFCDAP
jgi:hypothetical protein